MDRRRYRDKVTVPVACERSRKGPGSQWGSAGVAASKEGNAGDILEFDDQLGPGFSSVLPHLPVPEVRLHKRPDSTRPAAMNVPLVAVVISAQPRARRENPGCRYAHPTATKTDPDGTSLVCAAE